MSNLRVRINETIAEIKRLEKINQRLSEIQNTLKERERALTVSERKMKSELKDVEKLQSLSIKGLFYKVLGSKEEQLEKERQEHLDASLSYNGLLEEIDILQFEQRVLSEKSASVDNLKSTLENYKRQRENEILQTNPQLSSKLLALAQEMDQLIVLKREMLEALVPGQKSYEVLGGVLGELKKAQQWGNWDMMSSKSRQADYMKYGAIDRAKHLSYQAKHHLAAFKKELADFTDVSPSYSFNIESFGSFMDTFFDNLISDWIMQQRIVKTLKAVKNVRNAVGRNLDQIKKDTVNIEANLVQLNKKRDGILTA